MHCVITFLIIFSTVVTRTFHFDLGPHEGRSANYKTSNKFTFNEIHNLAEINALQLSLIENQKSKFQRKRGRRVLRQVLSACIDLISATMLANYEELHWKQATS